MQPPAPPKIAGTLKAPLLIDPRHRARDYPGSQRLRVRAAGQEAHEVAYVAVPAGADDPRGVAEQAYLSATGLKRENVNRVIAHQSPGLRETMHQIVLDFNPATGEVPASKLHRLDMGVALAMLRRAEATIEQNVLAPKPAVQVAPPGLASRLLNGRG